MLLSTDIIAVIEAQRWVLATTTKNELRVLLTCQCSHAGVKKGLV